MAFGGGSGGFSFGSSTNNNNSTGFGGFGSNTNNTTGGFGTNTSGTGFGTSTAASNPFGGSTFGASNTAGGFGSSNTANTSSLFGSKPNPFGASTTTSSGGLFGGNTATSNTGGFSGSTFGGNTNTNTVANTGGFGGSSNTSGGFSFGGANKPAFGSSTTTPLFGQGGSGTTGGFGGSTTSSPFRGGASGTALNGQVPPAEGTHVTQFNPVREKDGPSSSLTNEYQSITFMQPYQKYSFEELRIADYAGGRQYGNATGTSGGFGSNTFGGFNSSNTGGAFGGSGSSGGGLFGTNNNTAPTTNMFGGGSAATNPFGSSPAPAGNSLFNQSKPGGLFGTQSSGTSSGGLFGTAPANTGFGGSGGAFGANNSGSNPFGGQQSQSQQKPGLFGTTAPTGTGFSFGGNNQQSTNTNTGGLFGNSGTTNNAFGGLNQPASSSNSLFGNLGGANNQQKPPFGTSTTQSQPAGGLFGTQANTGTGGGLFGTSSTQAQPGSLFGGQSNTGTGGGLFGNTQNQNQNQNKGGLFGSTFGGNTGTNGGLFANNNQQQQQQQQPQGTGGGLFGGSGSNFSFGGNQNKPTSSLFNTSTTQPSQGLFNTGAGGNSLFGGSQTQQPGQQQQQDGFKTSSLLDTNPYGQSSIWTGLPAPTPENAKPLLTPLTATQKLKESMAKPVPSLRLNQSRYMTPPRRNGYGLSYSTYGTPSSAASTPGGGSLTGSMYGSRSFADSSRFTGGSFGRSMGKSTSLTNMRQAFAGEGDSVFVPGAFTPVPRYSGGSLRRLTINRTIRPDLFTEPSLPALPSPKPATTPAADSTPTPATTSDASGEPAQKLKKRVSFDKDTTGGQSGELNGETGALVPAQPRDEESPAPTSNSTSARSNGEQARGSELAAVPEDRETHEVSDKRTEPQAKRDPKPGDYWMKPTRAEIQKLPREKAQHYKGFQVGRYGCGKVTFDEEVDLTTLPFDELYEKLVEIRVRSITVYPDASSKPPVGKGLNVPSTLSIENSWPRARGGPSSATSGPIFDKHVSRLKRMGGTQFVSYEPTTGIWSFRVPHYTRYGLDYDDDDEAMEESELPAPPDSIDNKHADSSIMEVDDDYDDSGAEDDTFAFKQKIIPGSFNRRPAIEYDLNQSLMSDGPHDDDQALVPALEDDSGNEDNEVSMAGSYPPPTGMEATPLKPVMKPARQQGTPAKTLLDLDGDWADQLQRTISPRKQDRNVLRDAQSKLLLDRVYEPIKPKATKTKDFRTSIDIMNSLFGMENNRPSEKNDGADFEFPYAKRAKTSDQSETDMDENDKLWHASFKPKFTATGGFIYKSKQAPVTSQQNGWVDEVLANSHGRSVVVSSKEGAPNQAESRDIKPLLAGVKVVQKDHVPFVRHKAQAFSTSQGAQSTGDEITKNDLYELAHVLFDEYEDDFSFDLTPDQKQQFETQIREDRLSKFLSSFIWRTHGDRIRAEEKQSATKAALLYLSAKETRRACDALMKVENYHLMMLVSQMENADKLFQEDVTSQIAAWREQDTISEMSDEVRALYELASGNFTIVQGKSNVPVENKASTFSISEQYGLDWLQAFCLCLWYGKSKNGTIGDAVRDFSEKLQTREESAQPLYQGQEAPFWVLLKLYASKTESAITAPSLPEDLSAVSKTLGLQVAFDLHHALVSNIPGIQHSQSKADDLAADLSSHYTSTGQYVHSIWALLHISSSTQREAMIRDVLTFHAAHLPGPDQTQPEYHIWVSLTDHLAIPKSWIFLAKAFYSRAQNDHEAEFHHLISAESWDEAHECLMHRVAPRLVIDEDYARLRDLLSCFKKPEEIVEEWEMGGRVYADFIALADPHNLTALLNQGKNETRKMLERLQRGLVDKAVTFRGKGDLASAETRELEERVAVLEMGKRVAELIMDGEDEEMKSGVLGLPVTRDIKMGIAREMAVEHYWGVMTGVH